jgi:hypothetical protein
MAMVKSSRKSPLNPKRAFSRPPATIACPFPIMYAIIRANKATSLARQRYICDCPLPVDMVAALPAAWITRSVSSIE